MFPTIAPIWMDIRKRGITFQICFRKRKFPKSGRRFLSEKEVPTLEETMMYIAINIYIYIYILRSRNK